MASTVQRTTLQIPNVATNLIGPFTSQVKIESVTVENTTGAGATYGLYLMANGGTQGAANEFVNAATSVATHIQAVVPGLPQYLNPGEVLSGISGTNNALTAHIDYVVLDTEQVSNESVTL